ncbi:P-loop ATPase, Sll1717 family [Leptospira alexanderi]|uniref:P-loop ATPase, Sll1717 family n=1 Tax=Leptospira alexanderi TaxID=100053 RepID=UPI000990DF3D|nr:hypothetical protein [Leptospira alexanderi]
MKKIFFAYEGGHSEISDTIKRAIIEFNSHQKTFRALRWEEMDIIGKVLNKSIFKEIEESEWFACDLSYINHNVMFELGYAVGKKKKILIFLNLGIVDAKENYSNSKLLRNIGYLGYTTHKHIQTELQTKSHEKSILLNEMVNLKTLDKDSKDVLYISPQTETQASLELTELLQSKNYSVVFDDSSEVEYQTVSWYINSLNSCKTTIIHLLGHDRVGSHNNNSEASFYAGIAAGLGKKVLILAPSPFKAPIDYEDILLEYENTTECAVKTDDWLRETLHNVPSPNIVNKNDDQIEETLLRLGIGAEVAESEKDDLLNYFIESEAYRKAQTQEISIFVGRKGTGKTALFIRLEKDFDSKIENYNIVLKPESDELLEDVEIVSLFSNERVKRTYYFAIWKFIFYNKLLVSVVSKISGKTKRGGYEISPLERELLEIFEKNRNFTSLNFFGALRELDRGNESLSLVGDPKVIERLFNGLLSNLMALIHAYFRKNKYAKINILADNLDKTWDSRNDLNLQGEMILSLIEYSAKLINELSDKAQSRISGATVILLRKDIFEYILKLSREPDKLVGRHYEINWTSHSKLLRKVVEKRFQYKLNLESSAQVEKVWKDYFDFSNKEDPFNYIKKYVIPRPRDIIYFIIKLFESAINNDSTKVTDNDIDYAIDAYSNFLNNNLIAELKAEFPNIGDIMAEVRKQYYNYYIDYYKFLSLLEEMGMDRMKISALMQSLFTKQYLLGFNETKSGEIIDTYAELSLYLKKRKLFIFKYRISLVLNPNVSFLRSGSMRF